MTLFDFFSGPLTGPITAPGGVDPNLERLGDFISNIYFFLVTVAGLWTFLNFVLAGYGFLNGGNDPKNIVNSWAKIYQSLIGLVIIAGASTLIAVISLVIFNDPSAILKIYIYGPGK